MRSRHIYTVYRALPSNKTKLFFFTLELRSITLLYKQHFVSTSYPYWDLHYNSRSFQESTHFSDTKSICRFILSFSCSFLLSVAFSPHHTSHPSSSPLAPLVSLRFRRLLFSHLLCQLPSFPFDLFSLVFLNLSNLSFHIFLKGRRGISCLFLFSILYFPLYYRSLLKNFHALNNRHKTPLVHTVL